MNTQLTQRVLFELYRQSREKNGALPTFGETGFRVYSQNDEDGLLLYIFSLIGFTNKVCVELAFGLPSGANTTNLICNWGFTGLLIEANEDQARQSRDFFSSHPDTWTFPPRVLQAWVTAENANQLLQDNGMEGEIDLFSLDVDGIDYWIWKSINVIQPRVIVVEYQNIWGSDRSVTVPYDPNFRHSSFDYCGASLAAFIKLGRTKGYRLVGVNRYGFNAFFVRSGLAEDLLPEIGADKCFEHPQAQDAQKNRIANAMKFEWVEV